MFIIYMAYYIQHGTECCKEYILKCIAFCTNCVIELWLQVQVVVVVYCRQGRHMGGKVRTIPIPNVQQDIHIKTLSMPLLADESAAPWSPHNCPFPVPVKVSNIVFNDMPVSIIAGSLWGVLCLSCSFYHYKKENEIFNNDRNSNTNYFLT